MESRQQYKTGDIGLDTLEIKAEFIHQVFSPNNSKKWLSYSLEIPAIDPLAYIEQVHQNNNLYYWEHPEKNFALAAGGALEILKATGSNRFREISDKNKELRRKQISVSELNHSLAEPVMVGGYSFSDHNVHQMWKKFGAAHFVLPEWTIIKSGDLHILTLTVECSNRKKDEIIENLNEQLSEFIRYFKSIQNFQFSPLDKKYGNISFLNGRNSYNEWKNQVNRSREMILADVFKKIVIARQVDITTDKPVSVSRAMFHLRRQFPECFNFMIKIDGGPCFIGATPERLVSLKRNMMQTEGLAGSISRGESASEDMALGHSLMESKKDRSEHEFVVKDIRSNLQKHKLRVDHPHQPAIKKLSNVQHLYTPITAEVTEDITLHELAGMLHPTPAVGGYPKETAVPYISEIEDIDRGWYAGPVGWCNASGSGEFAVAIRSAWIDGKNVRLFAGCGIVENSDPDNEWAETEMKLSPILGALNQATNHRR
jgi:menaquinone-specific isochorismate synthase